jgi:hypothetical protein
MFETKQNAIATKLAKWTYPRLDNFEWILFGFFMVGLVLKLVFKLPMDVLIKFALGTLSLLYFSVSFADIQNEALTGFERFMFKVAALSCSISSIGLLHIIMVWPGAKLMALTALIGSLGSLLIIFIINKKNPDQKLFNTRWFVRLLIFSATILIYLKVMHTEAVIDMGFIYNREYFDSE